MAKKFLKTMQVLTRMKRKCRVLYPAGGNVKQYNYLQESQAFSSQDKDTPTILFSQSLRTYSREKKIMFTRMFTATLFIVAPSQKQSKCSTTGESLNKL